MDIENYYSIYNLIHGKLILCLYKLFLSIFSLPLSLVAKDTEQVDVQAQGLEKLRKLLEKESQHLSKI